MYTVVLHCLKVQPYKVGQEECVLGKIPCPVSHRQRIRRVRARARRGKAIGRRHGGGGLPKSGQASSEECDEVAQTETRRLVSQIVGMLMFSDSRRTVGEVIATSSTANWQRGQRTANGGLQKQLVL
jgi:hypothetical protein